MTITIVWLPLHNAVKIVNLILLKYQTWWQNQEQSYTNREMFSLTICQSAVQCCMVCYRNWLDLWCNSGAVDWFYSSEMSIASFSCKVGVYLMFTWLIEYEGIDNKKHQHNTFMKIFVINFVQKQAGSICVFNLLLIKTVTVHSGIW